MDIRLLKIGQRDRKIPISKLGGEPGKIGQTAWQNRSDVTKIRSATVGVNGALTDITALTANVFDATTNRTNKTNKTGWPGP